MSIQILFEVPTRERRVGRWPEALLDVRGGRHGYYDYLTQVARAAELAGFDGVHVPDDPDGDQPWIVSGVIARETERLRVLSDYRPAAGSAVYAAKQAVSFQRFSEARLDWHVYDDDNAPRIEELIDVVRGVFAGPPFTFRGKFFEVENGGFDGALGGVRPPRFVLSGRESSVVDLAARKADGLLFVDAPLEVARTTLAQLASHGRSLDVALSAHVVARATDEEATIERERIREPRLSIVGSYETVTERLAAYAALGVRTFVLSASPHLEEAYRLGEHVASRLRQIGGRALSQVA